ncbi:MAG: hypothetical protein AB1742_03420 [bacterium]
MKKRILIIAAVVAAAALSFRARAEDFEHGEFHFVPKLGYLDPRSQGTKGDMAYGADVLYEWAVRHGLKLGFTYSRHDVTDQSETARSRILSFGYRCNLPSPGEKRGRPYLGADIASHRVTFLGEKYQKMGGTLLGGYEWYGGGVAEISYLFAGSDEDVRLGGLAVFAGYRF